MFVFYLCLLSSLVCCLLKSFGCLLMYVLNYSCLFSRQQRMANLAQAPQLFYSPHAQWGTNSWRFPSPLYDVTPMPPSYHFAQPSVHPGHPLPQRPMYYGMTASPHYNNFVSTPSAVTGHESGCRPNESELCFKAHANFGIGTAEQWGGRAPSLPPNIFRITKS